MASVRARPNMPEVNFDWESREGRGTADTDARYRRSMASESAKDWGAMFSAGASPNGMSAPPQAYHGVRAAASAQYHSTSSPSCVGGGAGTAARGGGAGGDFAPHATSAVAVNPSKVRLEKRSMLRL